MKIFKEQQRFTQLWLILLLAISAIAPITLICRKYFEYNSMTTKTFVISILGIALASSLIFMFKLTTRIDEKGIHYKFFPFHLNYKLISWKDIVNADVKTYDPIGDFGGWGLKGGFLWKKEKGKAVNVSGDIGIQLELKSGKKLLIGTKKKDEAIRVLKTYRNKMSKNA